MKKAIYAASLDPITHGHVNVIQRALKVFDQVIVAIGVNETKKPLFSLQGREEMAKKELAKFGRNVRVTSFQGMLSDFAYEQGVGTIIRGARSTPDFDYEKLLGDINRYSGVDTVIYTSIPELSHISSSAARAITLNCGENILDYVSLNVKRKLEEALLYQYRIGITGVIGSGKSTVVKDFINFMGSDWSIRQKINLYEIDMDHIGHYILEEGEEPICKEVREYLGPHLKVQKKDGFVDVRKLSGLIFKSILDKNMFDDAMKKPMMHFLRKKFLGYKGTSVRKNLVLITGALLCEAKGLSEFNNNIVFVDAPQQDIIRRLKENRKYSDAEIRNRMDAQLNLEGKMGLADTKLREDRSGNMWTIKNGDDSSEDDRKSVIREVFRKLCQENMK